MPDARVTGVMALTKVAKVKNLGSGGVADEIAWPRNKRTLVTERIGSRWQKMFLNVQNPM